MKKTVSKIVRTIILVMLLFMAATSTCYAEVNIEELQGRLNVMSQQQINQVNNPKYAERNNVVETIDPITGNLILKQNDLSLTGKDGLDLDITRIYNSSQGEYENGVNITTKVRTESYHDAGWRLDVILYNITSGATTHKTIPQGSYDMAVEALDFLDGREINGFIYETSKIWYEDKIITEYITDYIKNDYTDKYSYNKTRYFLGAGWSLGFPSVQIIREEYNTSIYFHDGSGAAYRVTNTSDIGESNLEGYQGKDVKFLWDNGSYVNTDGISSSYKFINSDLTTTYFGNDGRILGIKDRLNNEIKYRYQNVPIYDKSFPLISQIIDSVGRCINFSYTGDNIELTVKAPHEANPIKIVYGRKFLEQSVNRNGTVEKYQYPTLDYVMDPKGIKTYYERYRSNNAYPMDSFSYTSKDIVGKNTKEKYLLGGVIYPGSKTLYQYEQVTRNLDTDGAAYAYRVRERHDEIQRKSSGSNTWVWLKNNEMNYTYIGDCSGYPTYTSEESMYKSNTYQFDFVESASDGLKTKTSFNGKKQLTQIETTASNNEKQLVKNLEFDKTYDYLPTKKEYSEYTANGALAHTYYSGMTYTPWGGIASETNEITAEQYNNAATKSKYTTTYHYDNPTFQYFLTKTQWYQSDAVALSESYSYNSQGRLSSYTNAKGEVTNFNYYTKSNTVVEEQSIQLENGKVAKTKSIYGSETGYAYPKEIISTYTNNQGAITSVNTKYTYNMLLGLVLTETDNENKTTSYSYDIYGRVTQVKQPDYTNSYGDTYGVKQEYSYSDGYNWNYHDDDYDGINGTTVNMCTEYVDKAKNTSSYYNQYSVLYDDYGDLRLEMNRLAGSSTGVIQSKYYYDAMQRVILSIDATGNTVSQSYDPWGNVGEVSDASGNLYITGYDVMSNKATSYFVAKNNISAYRANTSANTYKENYLEVSYDQFDRPIQRKVFEKWPTQSGELSEEYSYDIVGNLISYTDPKKNRNADGATVTYQYDSLNRIIGVKNAENYMTNVCYTILGDIASVTLSSGSDSTNVYTKSYDELGNNISKNQNKNLETSYSYNNIGLNTKTVDRNKNVEMLSYDRLNQLMERIKTNSDGTKSIGYKYCYTNPFGYSNVQLYHNGTLINQELYNYDSNGQVTYRSNLTNYINSSLEFQYDTAGRLLRVGTGVRGQNNFYTSYKYTNEKLTQVQTNGQQSSSTVARDNATYEYYPDGKLKKITYPQLNDNSYLTTEYSYNPIGRMTSLVNKKGSEVLSQFHYSYDANGNITSVYDGQSEKSYVYDKLNQLVEVQNWSRKKVNYYYDYRGNRVREVGGDFNLDLDIDYSYDQENKLKTVTKDTSTTTMSYYADGMRAKKESKAGMTNYIYNLSGQLVAEAKNYALVESNYVWGPDRVLAKKNNEGEYYYLYNGHGDVIQVVDRNGNVVNNYEYDEWGNIVYSKETVSNPFKYAGEVYDEETGLYYLRARYYDPKMGRFINEDTYEGQINDALSLNGYSYCNNNPLIHIDPSGHYLTSIAIEAVKIAAVVTVAYVAYRYATSPEVRKSAKEIAVAIKKGAADKKRALNEEAKNKKKSKKISDKKDKDVGKTTGDSKTVNDILKGAEETTRKVGKASNYEKSGGYKQALKDFDDLGPVSKKKIETQYGDGMYGKLNDGTSISVRPGSKTGGSTLEIKIPGKKIIKIRY
ncbi:MAG: RHS repeat-associated core domain-containing protein [Velocimicrobium sp.]